MQKDRKILVAGATSLLANKFIQSFGIKYNLLLLTRKNLLRELPKANILINCIGAIKLKSFMETSDILFDEIINVNLKIPFQITKQFILQGGQHIINIGSTRSISPAPNKAIYSASKAALRSFTQSINLETKTKASLICPGNFNDPEVFKTTIDTIDFIIEHPNIKEIIIGGQI